MFAPTDRAESRFASRRARPRNRWVACAVLVLTLALHVLPWLLWPPAAAPQLYRQPTVRVSVLRLEAAPPSAPGTARPDSPTQAVVRRAPRHVPERAHPAATQADAAAPPHVAAADPPPASASAAPAAPLDLDSPAVRRAIREAARSPSMADLGDAAPGADRKLGASIASGARGDCLKGEYAGGGMGLLSLPFLAIAKLRDQCSR